MSAFDREQQAMSPPLSPVPLLGEGFEQALQLAVKLHRAQSRKGGTTPYVAHLLGVCSIVLEDEGDEEEAIAALLHDAIEDQSEKITIEEIRADLGERVAGIVLACSDSRAEGDDHSSAERKNRYVEALATKPPEALRVSLADKLYNARAILGDYNELKNELWERFNVGRDEQLGYYRSLANEFNRLLPGRLATELDAVVSNLEQAVEREGGQRTRAAHG